MRVQHGDDARAFVVRAMACVAGRRHQRGSEIGRQMAQPHARAVADGAGMAQRVPQLSQVARPGQAAERLGQRRIERHQMARGLRLAGEHGADRIAQIRALAQRRQRELGSAEPVGQILAKRLSRDPLGETPPARRPATSTG